MSGTSHFWSRSRRKKNFGPGPGEKKILVPVPPGPLCPSLASTRQSPSHPRFLDPNPIKSKFQTRTRSGPDLPGKKKVRGSSPAKGYLFLCSLGIPSRCLVLVITSDTYMFTMMNKLFSSSLSLTIYRLKTNKNHPKSLDNRGNREKSTVNGL